MKKVVVNTKEFISALKIAQHGIRTTPIVPILEMAKIECWHNTLQIQTSDLTNTIKTHITVDIDDVFSFLIDKSIIKYIFQLKSDQIEIELITETKISIKSDKSIAEFDSILDVKDFPTTAITSSINTLPRSILPKLVSYIPFTSTEDLRPAMTGLSFVIKDNTLILAATDGHRLKFDTVKLPFSVPDITMIIPKIALKIISKIIGSVKSDIQVSFNGSTGGFVFNKTMVFFRVIDEKFPDWEKVVPNPEQKTILSIKSKELIREIDYCTLFTNRTTNRLVFNVNDKASISGEDLDDNKKYAYSFDQFTVIGNSVNIGLNGKFLKDIVNGIKSEYITFEIEKSNKAVIIYGSSAKINNGAILLEKDYSESHLLMPIMLSNN